MSPTNIEKIQKGLERDGIIRVQFPASDDDLISPIYKFAGEVVNAQDKSVINAVLEWAKRNDICEIELIDEEFVKAALIGEISRRAAKNTAEQHKGTVRVKLKRK